MDLMKVLLAGISAGLALAMLIGPAFFALLQTSLKNGFRSGVLMAMGILVSDAICVALAYLGASQFFGNSDNKLLIGVVGGVILITFGTYTALQKQLNTDGKGGVKIQALSVHYAMLKGFFMNMLNPFVFLYWIGMVGLVSSNFGFSHFLVLIFFVATLITVFSTDVLKCFLAHKISRMLNPKTLLWVNKGAGIILIISGVVMIIRVILPE